jgi:hypothetical protein
MRKLNALRFVPVIALGIAVSGCAGSVSEPVAMTPLPVQDRGALHISDISADAASGVQISDAEMDMISQKVRGYIQTQTPNVLAAPQGGAQPLKMVIHFTEFDRGSAFARAMLAGLGQIEITADVMLKDGSGTTVADYKVSKDFALGGVAGATTTVEDVEDGFAKSVAEIAKKA